MRNNFKTTLLCGLLILLAATAQAQQPAAGLEALAAKAPIEKAYLHTDRDIYFAGETVWFKAYMYSDFFPDTISTNLHVELLNKNSQLIRASVFPVIYATSRGQIDLPDSLEQGIYFLRAYSPTMLNNGEEFVYLKKLSVAGKPAAKTAAQPMSSKKDIVFFPESGNLLEGTENTVAFKITDTNGNPQQLGGTIKNQQGEVISYFNSYHDGMGSFILKPLPGEKLYAELDNDTDRKYELPAVAKTGVILKVLSAGQTKRFEIHTQVTDPAMRPAYMLGQVQHHPAFRLELDGSQNNITGVLNTKDLATGILHITVFNKDHMPLAERLCFVNNNNYQQTAQLLTDTLDFSERAKNRFTLSLPEGVAGSFSVSVTDAGYGEGERSDNIFSNLLLTSDLRGYIHNPSWYFSSSTAVDSAGKGLDLLMMTHGWTRFQWNHLAAMVKNKPRYNDPAYITLGGRINVRDRNKPLVNSDIVMMLFAQDSLVKSGPSMNFVSTDSEGRFKMDSMIFFGKTRFFATNNKGDKKKKWMDIYPDKDSLPRSLPLQPFTAFYKLPSVGFLANRINNDFDMYQNEQGKILEGITIRARTKTPLQALEDRYVTGLFGGMATKTVDLVNTNEFIFHRNIFEYIQGRIAGIQVAKSGLDYTLYYRQTRTMSAMIPMTLFLDEIQTDAFAIAVIPGNQIAMIKVFSYFAGAGGNASGGALAVYTKKAEDMKDTPNSSADLFFYNGYSVVKEFYSPDYSQPVAENKPDNRITLHWQPDIFLSGVKNSIPVRFYNNDRTKSFKIVAEGVTTDGKLLLIEKIVQQKAF